MSRGGKRVELPPKECAATGCAVVFERRPDQTTTQYRRQRFCTPACAAAEGVPTGVRSGMCGKGLHPMSGDNLYVTPQGGVRRCRACQAARDAARGARPSKAKPVDVVVPSLPGTRWRPAGWPDQPRTWHAGQAS